jgi:hypothetical protein
MEAATRYANSGGASIAYQVHGEGPPDLVFVPGFVSHVELYWEHPTVARFFRRLASFSRLVLFDKGGRGLSDRPARPPTLEESMDDLSAVMAAAGPGAWRHRNPEAPLRRYPLRVAVQWSVPLRQVPSSSRTGSSSISSCSTVPRYSEIASVPLALRLDTVPLIVMRSPSP